MKRNQKSPLNFKMSGCLHHVLRPVSRFWNTKKVEKMEIRDKSVKERQLCLSYSSMFKIFWIEREFLPFHVFFLVVSYSEKTIFVELLFNLSLIIIKQILITFGNISWCGWQIFRLFWRNFRRNNRLLFAGPAQFNLFVFLKK